MRRYYIFASVAFAALTAGWYLGLGARWTMRLPRDADIGTTYVGTQTNADPVTGVVPKDDVLSTYERNIRVTDAADWPRSVMLLDKYIVRDIETGAVVYEYATNERVDPRTGAWASGPHKGDIVLFPRHVEKRTYTMRGSYMAGVPLKFSGVGNVGGLSTYVFSYRGPLDLTASYGGTAAFPGIAVRAGQEIRCVDDQFFYRTWVEPLTGEQARVDEGCLSGDFIYEKATDRKVAAVDRWNGETAGAGLTERVTEIYSARFNYSWASLYFPAILVAACLGCLAAGVWPRHEPTPA